MLLFIPATNAILAELRTILSDYPRNKRIVEPYRTRILDAIARYDRAGFVDYISLSASILFSSNYVTNLAALRKEHLYHTVRLGDFSADGYLDGLTVTRKDYRELFAEYVHTPHVCFLIDPPYLSTQPLTYEGYYGVPANLWAKRGVFGGCPTTSMCYTPSTKRRRKSKICDDERRSRGRPMPPSGIIATSALRRATRIEQATNLNYNSHYTDIMLYRHINAGATTQTNPITNHQTAA